MALGLIGTKCGMTRVFTDEGQSIPVTVVEIKDNRVVQLKNADTDGYTAVQVSAGKKTRSRVTKALAGHFAKANVEAGSVLREFRVSAEELAAKTAGEELTVEMFSEGDQVDITGTSIGKGYAGVIKRHHFRTQDASHGNSLSHRAPGSIGQNQTPGKVFKGKKMSGHLGNVRRTAVNQTVVRIDKEKRVLLIKGAVPGHKGSTVFVCKSVKSKGGR